MGEQYRFFNSTAEDPREYRADEFAEYFNLFLSDGLFSVDGNAGLKVTADIGLNINVDIGYAFIKGYMYKNDSILPIAIPAADTLLDRIDRIVIKFDEINRSIHVILKQGISSSTPQPPTLENTATIKELSLSQVRVNHGATSITSINDERLTQYCGLVSSLISIPVEEMWNIWNGALTDIQSAWDTWFTSRQNQIGLRVMSGSEEPAGYAALDIWLKTL